MRGFFETAAALDDRRAWRRFPSDGHLFQVTCAPSGLHGWTGCVIGQHQENDGVILFDSVVADGSYLNVVDQVEAGDGQTRPVFPCHRSINYNPKSAMPKGVLREIRQYGWPVAGPDAYPTVMLVQPDLLLMPPRRMDVWRLQLIAQALCEWLDTEPQLADLWSQDKPAPRRRFRLKVADMSLPLLIGVADGRRGTGSTHH